MGTKWKSSVIISIWVFLFTFGLSGILSIFTVGSSYVHPNYFHTQEFRFKLDQFAEYLNKFELNDITLEQAKEAITVTENDINEYRNRYVSLTDRIVDLKAEYEYVIQNALETGNQEAADVYIAERDKKIEDITNGFKSDEYIKEKVLEEKERMVGEFFQEREFYRLEYMRYKEAFQYYFKNHVTGKVFTNLKNAEDELGNDGINAKEMLFVKSYFISGEYLGYYSFPGAYELAKSFIPFEGQIGVSKSLPLSNPVMIEYERYKQKQILLIVYIIASIGAFILCFYLKIAKVIPAGFESWRFHYTKLPIDLRIIIFAATGILAVNVLFFINEQIFYDIKNVIVYSWDIFSCIVMGSIVWCLTLIQGKFLVTELKDRKNFKEAWGKALLNKAGQGLWVLSKKIKLSLKDAFLNKSIGIQLFIVLAAVFGLGAAANMIVWESAYLLIYVMLLVFVGLPIIIILIKSLGYFNQVLIRTNELAVGNLGEDLPVTGKSVLAMLAGNINLLKQGVKTSQTEQAKSERLKTELITNVSHDLRTPLTSIITYTDLLKKEGVSDEDKIAYLEIIDSKSKRLKMLIDDLFEISKMASGNIELMPEKVDLIQLLQQALAEHDNAVKDSSLQFRIKYAEQPVYALVDGNKLWRVFDNLIENILKYSLENSRVYITVSSNGNQAMITFKNVSKFELSENIDELFERFKRGDTSRQTEGSGLGLAIAKSIVDLHDGSLVIETEGDLFKVSISLKLVN
ncbi:MULTISPECIES: sensor histidine kinase [unclassified Paenibacillus]|uniref:sensor histidine kinase n=1 Tax=unclassified Paenibacillus TaxID=185978 RepID=UPI002F405DDD